jgi:hypothetical protein
MRAPAADPSRSSGGMRAPAAPPPPPPAPPRAASPSATATAARNGGFHDLVQDVVGSARAAFDAHGIAVNVQVPASTVMPNCPPAQVRQALLGALQGLAIASLPRTQLSVRCERKPVLLKGRDGEVKRDFLMVALAHTGNLTQDEQQRVVQGTDPGPLGQATRLVREMGGFVRFAPLPDGAMEARVFLPVG